MEVGASDCSSIRRDYDEGICRVEPIAAIDIRLARPGEAHDRWQPTTTHAWRRQSCNRLACMLVVKVSKLSLTDVSSMRGDADPPVKSSSGFTTYIMIHTQPSLTGVALG
jgi:hypothetical protein